jgi:hypothetical protein
MERSKNVDWIIEDESDYENIDRDITRSMLSAAKNCGNRSKKRAPGSPALGMATQAIRYWDIRIKMKWERNHRDLVLNYYLSIADVDREVHDKTLSIRECIKQLNFSRQKLKDVVANAKEYRGHYEAEIAEAMVGFKEGQIFHPVEKEILVERELKTRENCWTAQWSWRKMGLQIRGHLKPNTLKRSKLMHVEIPNVYRTAWRKNQNKEEVERHLIDRNVEQFSHAANTPFGYYALGKELRHTGDSDMAESILNGTLEHECLENNTIHAIVGQLKWHPTIQGILKPIVTTADFQS